MSILIGKRSRWLSGVGLVGLSALGSSLLPTRAVKSADGPNAQPPVVLRFQGAGSCSATACHGSIAPVPSDATPRVVPLRNEHTTWLSDDPHSRAYLTLIQKKSKDIVWKLAGGKEPQLQAHQDERCLACHTTPRPQAELRHTEWMNQDGVGCESCHGPAEKWIGPHTTSDWKKTDRDARFKDSRFVPLQLLPRRAGVCVQCHVGRRLQEGPLVQDVNHDLIAAGHPRLNFEFSAYMERMPAHWVEKGRNADPDFGALKVWVGQLVSAKAALELHQGRAGDKEAPWPEFSEHDCYACHHTLADAAWRRNQPLGANLPGMTGWGSWYFPMANALLSQKLGAGTDGGPGANGSLEDLCKAMSARFLDREEAQTAVKAGIDRLDRELAGLSNVVLDGATVEALIRALDGPKAWQTVRNWDHAAQRYLALETLLGAWKRLDSGQAGKQTELERKLHELFEKLKFKDNRNSPHDFDPASVGARH
jgi:hypothetical protein